MVTALKYKWNKAGLPLSHSSMAPLKGFSDRFDNHPSLTSKGGDHDDILHSLLFSGHPPGEPQCYANAPLDNKHLALTCSWEGGFPRALIWWSSSNGDTEEKYEESRNILVLPSNVTYNSKSFTCHAQHPLFAEQRQCVLRIGKNCSPHTHTHQQQRMKCRQWSL